MADINQNPNEEQLKTIDFLVKRLLKQLSLENSPYTIEIGSQKGDGYLSRIYRIKIEGEEKNFVAKIALNDPETRKMMTIPDLFQAEIYFYDKIFPVFLDFQTKRKSIKFNHVGKCYLTHSEDKRETLIFEDLKQQGFDMWNRKLSMPKGHIVKVLQLYGRYHAISFALRDQEPEVFRKLADATSDAFGTCMRNYSQKIKDSFAEHLRTNVKYLEENAPENVLRKYNEIVDNWEEITCSVEDKEGAQSVFIHGDSWCNNIMFRETSGELQVRLLDFQLQKMASPALDLLYFFFVSATGSMLDDIDSYMKIYHDSFSDFLTELGSDPKVYPFEDLQRDLKQFGSYGIIFAAMVMKGLYVDVDEVPELREDSLDEFKKDIKEQKVVFQRIRDVVVAASNKGLI